MSVSLFGQNVYIPDANFKAYLVGNSQINTNNDTEIQVSEASSFDGGIYCPSQNISDLTGIESFTALTYLLCFNNQLTNLDVSQNTALIELNCSGNQLTSLDLSQNIALAFLNCSGNQLTSLDLSQNNALTALECYNNQLTSLDLSQNILLGWLFCENNQITNLDLSQNSSLDTIVCNNNLLNCLNIANGHNINMGGWFSAFGNPNLTCIQVDDAAWSTANWTWIDPQTSFSENCDYPSDCFTSSLTELTTSKNLIQILDMMGRETTFKPNTPLIYVYDDGSKRRCLQLNKL